MSTAAVIPGCSTSSSVVIDVANSCSTRSTGDLPRKRTVRCNRKAALSIKRIEFGANDLRITTTLARG